MAPVAAKQISVATDTVSTGLALSSAVGSFIDIPLNAAGLVGLNFQGLTASGATVTFLSSNIPGVTPASFIATRTSDGETRVAVTGRATLRLQVTTAGTGTITVGYLVTSEVGIVEMSSPLPPGTNVISAGDAAIGTAADAATASGANTTIIGALRAIRDKLLGSLSVASTRALLFADNYNTSVAANASVAVVHTVPSPVIYTQFNGSIYDAQAGSYSVQGSNDAFASTSVVLQAGSIAANSYVALGPYRLTFTSYRVVFTQGATAGIVHLLTSFTAA